MNWLEQFWKDGHIATVAAGIAGAAAMAATDWRSPWRFIQHIFVGTMGASFATPWLLPVFSKLLSLFAIDVVDHERSAAFVTGAFSIYVFETVLAIWRRKYGENGHG